MFPFDLEDEEIDAEELEEETEKQELETEPEKEEYQSPYDFEKLKEEKHGELALNIRCIKKAFKVRFENIFISVDDGTGKRMSEENEKW